MEKTNTEFDRKGFLNHTNCLYAYMEGASYHIRTADGEVLKGKLDTDALTYDHNKIKCSDDEKDGKLAFAYKLEDDDKIKSLLFTFQINTEMSRGFWQVSGANITIVRADLDKKKTMSLRIVDMYASSAHSFSCNALTLKNIVQKKTTNETKREPKISFTLHRFQLQPFGKFEKFVFADSFDCSVWLTIPAWTGLILIMFIISVVTIGIYFLLEIKPNDFKDTKAGIKFTQSLLESNNKVTSN